MHQQYLPFSAATRTPIFNGVQPSFKVAILSQQPGTQTNHASTKL